MVIRILKKLDGALEKLKPVKKLTAKKCSAVKWNEVGLACQFIYKMSGISQNFFA